MTGYSCWIWKATKMLDTKTTQHTKAWCWNHPKPRHLRGKILVLQIISFSTSKSLCCCLRISKKVWKKNKKGQMSLKCPRSQVSLRVSIFHLSFSWQVVSLGKKRGSTMTPDMKVSYWTIQGTDGGMASEAHSVSASKCKWAGQLSRPILISSHLSGRSTRDGWGSRLILALIENVWGFCCAGSGWKTF